MRADYTFAYDTLEGQVVISLHHTAPTWFPPSEC